MAKNKWKEKAKESLTSQAGKKQKDSTKKKKLRKGEFTGQEERWREIRGKKKQERAALRSGEARERGRERGKGEPATRSLSRHASLIMKANNPASKETNKQDANKAANNPDHCSRQAANKGGDAMTDRSKK